jgi:hypothetical protein
LRDFQPDLTTDVFGNFVNAGEQAGIAQNNRLVVRQGMQLQTLDQESFDFDLGGLSLHVRQSAAGIVIADEPNALIVATPAAVLHIRGAGRLSAKEGYFVGNHWRERKPYPVRQEGSVKILEVSEPKVLRLESD